MFDWASRLQSIPASPGVYIMKDKEEKILYIGKAKELKRRVRQYFQEGADPRPFVRRLPGLLGEIDVLLTHTDKEAMLLEASLIQQHQPPFNILLKEEQRYLCLRLDLSHSYPRLHVIRRSTRDAAPKPHERIFGPYLSGYAVRQTMELIERHFRLRTCSDQEMRNRTRPCLEYQIKRCVGPCALPVEEERYREHVNEVILFLEGKHQELVDMLRGRMAKAAMQRQYELAARFRDQIEAIEKMMEKQHVASEQDRRDRDIFGFFRYHLRVEIQLLTVRRGHLSGGRSFSFDQQEFDDPEILERFLTAYYLRSTIDMPNEILLPFSVEDPEALAELLGERVGRKVVVQVPEDGHEAQLIAMANKNAEQGFLESQKTEDTSLALLQRLQKRLRLSRLPYRIECVDNSHLQGRYPVSAVVVFEGGFPNRYEYRRYHLKEAVGGDDFGAMKEILTRRFKRGMAEDNLPDLMVIDGGIGQLKMALTALEELGLDGVEVVAIAKKRVAKAEAQGREDLMEDRIIVPGRKNHIPVRSPHRELFLLAHARDEAHDTAVTFHQKTRDREQLRSVLDRIPQIGPARKQALLKVFKSPKRVAEASFDELLQVPGITEAIAHSVQDFFRDHPDAFEGGVVVQ
ncbi:MAG: excinuclease ABC subunit UvrC [Myxococcales bacterium]|nr:excinuclease ABC subunit UvrC [Myxococcales bacterium]MCB9641914.1 excinuclease ABC subunit UvrC [Myxococcales bacterium]